MTSRQAPSTWHAEEFDYAYGYTMLDELHNFFPELLYDDVIFHEPRFHYFRHRMRRIFPQAYTRSFHEYNIYYASGRQQAFENFLQSSNLQVAAPPPPPPHQMTMNLAPPPSVSLVSTLRGLSPIQTPPSVPAQQINQLVLEPDAASQLFTSFFNRSLEHPLTTSATFRILGNLGSLFEDVPIVASQLDIETASSLCDLDRVPADSVCAICQDRGETTPWRRLHCGHIYHQQCIDTWFHQNVVCPVCRADVRTLAQQQPRTGGGSARRSTEGRP